MKLQCLEIQNVPSKTETSLKYWTQKVTVLKNLFRIEWRNLALDANLIENYLISK